MEYRILGQSGLEVSRLCFGALTIGPLQRNLTAEEGGAIIRHALELGVNFIDTAELYGTYEHIRFALKNWQSKRPPSSWRQNPTPTRGRAWSVVWKWPERGLGIDVIPIFLLHEQESNHTLRGHWPALEVLWKAQRAGGWCRRWGGSPPIMCRECLRPVKFRAYRLSRP